MVRPPERIPKVLKTIREVWERFPDLRLGQLLTNATDMGDILYYVEDEELVEKLERYHGEG
jgi:hypothetical protein